MKGTLPSFSSTSLFIYTWEGGCHHTMTVTVLSFGSSKVIVCHAVTFHMSHVICQMLMFTSCLFCLPKILKILPKNIIFFTKISGFFTKNSEIFTKYLEIFIKHIVIFTNLLLQKIPKILNFLQKLFKKISKNTDFFYQTQKCF